LDVGGTHKEVVINQAKAPMESLKPMIVMDSQGRQGVVESDVIPAKQSGSQVLIRFESMPPMAVPADMLILRRDGHYELPLSVAELAAQANPASSKQSTVIPILEEEVHIGKHQVETGKVRVKKVVQEKQEWVDVPLMREAIEIKRVPINRPVDSPVAVRKERETIIVSLLEEVLVVQKQLVLKEEIHITTQRSEHHQPQQVTLRREEVLVEPVETESSPVQP